MSEHMQRVSSSRRRVEKTRDRTDRGNERSRRKSADVEAARQADGRVGRQAAG